MFEDSFRNRPPKDSDMVRHFHEHEKEFEALLEQVDDWPSGSWITPTNQRRFSTSVLLPSEKKELNAQAPLSEEQEAEIQVSLERLNLKYVSVGKSWMDEITEIRMNAYSEVEQKGYVYLYDPDWQKVYDKNLNKIDVYGRVVFRQIEGNWFLYLRGKEQE